MPRAVTEWLITDTHFNHQVLEDEGLRPEGSTQIILDNLRRTVLPQDFLIHLGDVIFYDNGSLKAMLDSIPCRKVLVIGNHDKKGHRWYMRNGFDFACDQFTRDGVVFSHRPIDMTHRPEKVNIHGHWHADNHRHFERAGMEWYNPVRNRLLALETEFYEPVRLIDFLKRGE